MARIPLYVLTISIVVAVGAFEFGFGSAVFVTSLGQPGFYIYFELDPTAKHTADIISAVNGLFYFGAAVGSLFQSWLADRWGRKAALAVAATIALIGNALVAGSVNVPMLAVVRVIQGGGLGMLLSLVPLYLAEVSPPHHRGLLTGLTTIGFGLGYVICSWMALGCYYASNLTLSWRLPLALACAPPFPLLIGLYFVPESPRYLAWRGKAEEAWTIVKNLHQDPADPEEEIAHAEFTQIVRQVEAEREDNITFIKMLKRPSWRRRSLLACFIMFAAQGAGIYGITNYLPVIFASLGMTGAMPLVMYGMWGLCAAFQYLYVGLMFAATHTTVGTVAVLASILVVDRFGRRTLIFIGYISLAAILLAEALLQWKYVGTDDKAGNAACVLFIFLYIVFFQGVDAPGFILAAEVFPTQLRAKGLSLALCALFIGTITFSTPAPVAFQTIGWRMFLIYFGFTIISAVIVYFYLPETKGLPIEEIGALFGDEVIVHLTRDGHGLVEDKVGDGTEHEKPNAIAIEKV